MPLSNPVIPLTLAALALGGCVTQQQATVTPHPVVAAARERLVNKTTVAGSTVEIERVTAVNPDCSPVGRVVLRVTQEPVHGTARIADRDAFPSYPPANPRSACNTRRVPSAEIDYVPAPGFIGADFLAYEIITPDGRDVPTKASITVK